MNALLIVALASFATGTLFGGAAVLLYQRLKSAAASPNRSTDVLSAKVESRIFRASQDGKEVPGDTGTGGAILTVDLGEQLAARVRLLTSMSGDFKNWGVANHVARVVLKREGQKPVVSRIFIGDPKMSRGALVGIPAPGETVCPIERGGWHTDESELDSEVNPFESDGIPDEDIVRVIRGVLMLWLPSPR
jgi:hypothetical protein